MSITTYDVSKNSDAHVPTDNNKTIRRDLFSSIYTQDIHHTTKHILMEYGIKTKIDDLIGTITLHGHVMHIDSA